MPLELDVVAPALLRRAAARARWSWMSLLALAAWAGSRPSAFTEHTSLPRPVRRSRGGESAGVLDCCRAAAGSAGGAPGSASPGAPPALLAAAAVEYSSGFTAPSRRPPADHSSRRSRGGASSRSIEGSNAGATTSSSSGIRQGAAPGVVARSEAAAASHRERSLWQRVERDGIDALRPRSRAQYDAMQERAQRDAANVAAIRRGQQRRRDEELAAARASLRELRDEELAAARASLRPRASLRELCEENDEEDDEEDDDEEVARARRGVRQRRARRGAELDEAIQGGYSGCSAPRARAAARRRRSLSAAAACRPRRLRVCILGLLRGFGADVRARQDHCMHTHVSMQNNCNLLCITDANEQQLARSANCPDDGCKPC